MFHAFVGRGPTIDDADALRAQALRDPQAVRDRDRGLGARRPQVLLLLQPLVPHPRLQGDAHARARSADYFADDLGDPLLDSAICMFHSRFSTNTFPSWELAHPYRMISHNGEINTLRGNINWMRAREALFASDLYEPGDVEKLLPIIREGLSDTACLDNAVELLVRSGYSLPHAMMMLIPEAWENHETMSQVKKDFYAYHTCLMEPWDGPASVGFTDGKTIGAVLDRNGLRPSRYVVTKDDLVIMASEVGALDIAPEDVVQKGRLEPGKMFLVDLEQGRIVDDEELKHADRLGQALRQVAPRAHGPPGRAARGARRPRPRPRHAAPPPAGVRLHARGPQVHPRPDGQQRRGGDRLDGDRHPAGRALRPRPAAVQLLQAALRPGDQPAARRDPRGAGDLGLHRRRRRGQPARCPTPESCRQIALDMPILDNDELARLKQLDGWRGFKSVDPADALPGRRRGRRAWSGRSRRCSTKAVAAIEDGANLLILSDRGVDAEIAPIPSLLACSGLHHHLVRKGLRTRAGLVDRVRRRPRGPPLRPAARLRRRVDQPVRRLRDARRHDPARGCSRPGSTTPRPSTATARRSRRGSSR